MTFTHRALASASLAAALALLPAVASAQAAGSDYLSVSTAPTGLVYAPGTSGAIFGTLTLTGTRPGSVAVASLPITFAGTNGASAANLSGCTLANASGTLLNTGGNAFNVMSAGTNTFTFDVPLQVENGAPQTLTLRCGLASSAPVGASYSYTIGAPALAPALSASLTSFPSVSPGEQNAPIAAITLNPGTSGANLNVSSLPLAATYSGGLVPGMLSDCRLTNAAGATLDQNASGLLNAGANTLVLDTTLGLTGGGSAMPLLFSCDVSAAAPAGGSLALALAPAGVVAASAATGAAVTATGGYDPATGAVLPLSGSTAIGGGAGGVTPPDTGAGAGAPAAIAAMVAAALLALAGWGLLLRGRF
jgi:hypothetical protein